MLWGYISIFELLRKPRDRQTQGPGGVLSGREALGTTAGADAAHPEVLLRIDAKGTPSPRLPFTVHTGQVQEHTGTGTDFIKTRRGTTGLGRATWNVSVTNLRLGSL